MERLRGPLFEAYVQFNLAGILSAWWPRAELNFWSVQGRHEVDFVASLGRRCVGIEVKAGSRFRSRELGGLETFLETTPEATAGILAYNGTEAVVLGERLYAVPMAWLLSQGGQMRLTPRAPHDA
jgi:predicted AAA+ superfamily ATPase